MDDVVCEYYLRFMARDKPGVLGAIASVLGRNGISIASVIQQERGAETTVPVIMRTHEARERNLKRALAEITRLKMVQRRAGLYPNRGATVTRWRRKRRRLERSAGAAHAMARAYRALPALPAGDARRRSSR